MKVRITKPVVFSKYGLNVEIQEYLSPGRKEIFNNMSNKNNSDSAKEGSFGDKTTQNTINSEGIRIFENQQEGPINLNSQSRQEVENETYDRVNRYGSAINQRDPDYFEGRTDTPNDSAKPYVKQQKNDLDTLSDDDKMKEKAEKRSGEKKKAYVSAIKHFYTKTDALRDSILREASELLHLKLVQSDPKFSSIGTQERARTIKDLEDKLYLKGNYESLRTKPQPASKAIDSLAANAILLEMVMQGADGSDQVVAAFMKKNRMEGYMKHIGTAVELIAIVPFLAPAARGVSLTLRTVQGFTAQIAVEVAKKQVTKNLKAGSFASNSVGYAFDKAASVAGKNPAQDLVTQMVAPTSPQGPVNIGSNSVDSSMYEQQPIDKQTFYNTANENRQKYLEEHGISIGVLKEQYTAEIWKGINEAYDAVLDTIKTQDNGASPEQSYKNEHVESGA